MTEGDFVRTPTIADRTERSYSLCRSVEIFKANEYNHARYSVTPHLWNGVTVTVPNQCWHQQRQAATSDWIVTLYYFSRGSFQIGATTVTCEMHIWKKHLLCWKEVTNSEILFVRFGEMG